MDTWFLNDHRPRLARVHEPELYIVVRHGHNTWNNLSNGAPGDSYFSRLPVHSKPLSGLVEPLDLPFYRAL